MHTLYTFSVLLSQARLYKKELILANTLAILAVIVSIPTPLLMPILVDEVLLNKPGFVVSMVDAFISGRNEPYVYVLVMLFLALLTRGLFYIFSYYQTKFFTIVSKNIAYKLRKDALNHLSKVSTNAFELMGSGKISSLLVVDIDTIDNFLGSFISRFIVSVLTMLGVGAVLLWIHAGLAVFILLVNPIVVVFTTKLAKRVSVLKKEQNSAFEIFQDTLSETLDLFVQVRSLNKEKSFFSKTINNAKNIKDTSIAFGYKSEGASKLSFLVFLSGFEIFRGASILVVAYSDLTIGLMLAIFGYLWVMMTPIQDILNIQYAYHNAQKALERINGIFALKLEDGYAHTENPFENTSTNAIEVRHLSFGYETDKSVLNDISLSIPKGKKVAIVGASGSGKTTLAHLLVGLYPMDCGDILFDNVSIKEIGLDVVRENVFLVLQNPQLFNTTIAQNLMIDKQTDKQLVENALKIAQLETFVSELKDGIDAKIGKNGIRLSGGQRQRLSIARMVLQNPNIVILDESTSALDVHTESRLFDALERYLDDKTTVIIAHRLSTIRKADYIYVLDKGLVVEQGTHEELIKSEGVFFGYVSKNSEKLLKDIL
ncbi:MAG: ABC transporter ATP-binding protein [Sulfurospirillaceae bacterium]|nr:ABC transporter ATP-binding protein [Sulfurospirillaceae bacterium]